MTDEIFNTVNINVKDEDLDRMLSFDLSDEEVQQVGLDIGFSGYDPVITFNIIMKVIGKDKDRKKSLLTLIVFGLTRGFGNGKTKEDILDRTNLSGKSALSAAFQMFRVHFGKPKDKKMITISRILTAFPVLTYKMHEKLLSKDMIKDNKYVGLLPIEFQYPGSPSMMTKESWDAYKHSYTEYIEHLHTIWGKPYNEEEIEKYAELSYSNKLSTLGNRK